MKREERSRCSWSVELSFTKPAIPCHQPTSGLAVIPSRDNMGRLERLNRSSIDNRQLSGPERVAQTARLTCALMPRRHLGRPAMFAFPPRLAPPGSRLEQPTGQARFGDRAVEPAPGSVLPHKKGSNTNNTPKATRLQTIRLPRTRSPSSRGRSTVPGDTVRS